MRAADGNGRRRAVGIWSLALMSQVGASPRRLRVALSEDDARELRAPAACAATTPATSSFTKATSPAA